MRREPALLVMVSFNFAESHLGELNIFHMNTRSWASLARWDRVFFNQFCFFRMLIK